jgi:hypothetical protein
VKTLPFSGYKWIAKTSKSPVGPGPNYFSDSIENVWIDKQGQLHLKITKKNGKWYCAQANYEKSLGYGKYIFHLAGINRLDKNVVVGLYTYDDLPEYNHREIDIEFSKWGKSKNNNARFVVQPRSKHKFNTQLNKDSTHSFDWKSKKISFQSPYKSWIYKGKNIPKPGNENPRINLWLFKEKPPSDNKEIEIVIKKFEFIPKN